ncbi:hypothetical protein PF003_g34831 [Phytophthora fragariae]|nr:hypothetical protein PF003_g34831 [Phytophthora fragariae]
MKRKHDEPVGARNRRRVSSRYPMETASSLGGVAVFKDVWGALVKAGWTSKRPSSKCLDTRYKYIRPGGRHDGAEGVDYLLGELAVLRYIEDLRVSEVPAEDAAPGTIGQEVVAGCGAGERGARGRGAGGRHGGRTAGQGVEAETSGVGDSFGVSVSASGAAGQAGVAEDGMRGRVGAAGGRADQQGAEPDSSGVRDSVGVGASGAAGQAGVAGDGVREGVAHEGAVRERVVQEGVARQEDVEDVRPNKVRVQPAQKAYLCLGLLQVTQFLTLCVLVVQALNRTAGGWATASVWAPVGT